MSRTTQRYDHAVVIGGSMAGLLTARVLSDHFEQVTLIEADKPHDGPEPRKGVPQGRHTHAVLSGGAEIIDSLFPGMWDEMCKAGTRRADLASDWAWFHYGVWKSRQPSQLYMYCQTRPFLEWHVSQRVQQIDNVTIRPRHKVTELLHDDQNHQVIGVAVAPRDAGKDEQPFELRSTLVVDTSGRGTRAPKWLEQLGYGRPEEELVKTEIGYASRIVRLRDDLARDWACMLVYPQPPHDTRVGYIFAVEGGRHIVTLAGYCADYPPADEDGFTAYARSLCRPEYFDALRDSEPLSPISSYRLPGNLRRRYEQMSRFPDGMVVLGDAVCSFNPLFGQGMTTAAFGAKTLQECLASHGRDIRGLSQDFQKKTCSYNDVAWLLATSEDLRYPDVEGKRMPGLGALNWYKRQLLEMSSFDPDLQQRFLALLNFKAGLSAILHPGVVAKALRWGARRRLGKSLEALDRFPTREALPQRP